ncbi:hypothetical protein OUZ56_021859 [Daphnia magna]|uniref:Uncharacterized protein n=1 Tax=Daphnia magna TaxID=35525 RepID=A0ABR0AUW5_9CRUS|nr:hypothetical protein OUZ56_021859 [Daphnia magna]
MKLKQLRTYGSGSKRRSGRQGGRDAGYRCQMTKRDRDTHQKSPNNSKETKTFQPHPSCSLHSPAVGAIDVSQREFHK